MQNINALLYNLSGFVVLLLGGLTILVPVLALSIRFALKPLVESIAQLRAQRAGRVEAAEMRERLERCEAELMRLRASTRHLVPGEFE
jgi:hypothetical protein